MGVHPAERISLTWNQRKIKIQIKVLRNQKGISTAKLLDSREITASVAQIGSWDLCLS
jgi:hypothetical protein